MLLEWGYNVWSATSKLNQSSGSQLPFLSIVIVSRNDSSLLSDCVASIYGGTYPKDHYEIIVVNDHSEDDSFTLLEDKSYPNLTVLNLKDVAGEVVNCNYKKAGQAYGIRKAKNDWIVTTDGDCICPSNWLATIANYTDEYDVMTGPIKMIGQKSYLSDFQIYDVMATMILTCFGIKKKFWFSANAANMAIRKSVFSKHQDLRTEEYVSGDDMFLIQWAAKEGYKVGFMRDASVIVETAVESSWKDLFNQRRRWAAKTNGYKDIGMQSLIYFIGMLDLSLIVCLAAFIIGGLSLGFIALITIGVKCFADWRLLYGAAPFFGLSYHPFRGVLLTFLHTVYVVVIGITSLFSSTYNWKGRAVTERRK